MTPETATSTMAPETATYPGGKNGFGVYQKIISLMPKHKIFIEGFLGSGAIIRRKKPAEVSFAVEIDQKQAAKFQKSFGCRQLPPKTAMLQKKTIVVNDCFLSFIKVFASEYFPKSGVKSSDVLIYLDPPYLMETRKSKNRIYAHEFYRQDQHIKLLKTIKNLKFNVMISGYSSDLYMSELGWRNFSFKTTDRQNNVRHEFVWMNFEKPSELHDYKFLGRDRRQRERIKKKQRRLKRRLSQLPLYEALSLIEIAENIKADLLSPFSAARSNKIS